MFYQCSTNMASFKIVIRGDRVNSRGESPLYLRITHNRKKRYLKLDLSIPKKDWNGGTVRKSHTNSEKLNVTLRRFHNRAQEAYLHVLDSGQPVTAEAIKQELQGVNTNSFYEYFDRVVQFFSYWQKKKYDVLKRKLQRYHKGDLLFSEITPDFLRGFEQHLEEEEGNAQNTRSKELGRIRRILNQAMKENVIQHRQNPFALGQVELNWKRSEVTALTPQEFKEFCKPHFPKDHVNTLYQRTFMFCVYADGMRIGDCIALPSDSVHEDVLSYNMMKTGKPKNIELPTPALEILRKIQSTGKWLFPYLSDIKKYNENTIREEIKTHTAKINKGIKAVAKKAKIKKNVSTHVARHTFTYLADENGWSLTEIQEATGHSNIQQVRDYIGRIRADRLTKKRKDLFD